MVRSWRLGLVVARAADRIGRWIWIDGRSATLLVLLAPAGLYALRDQWKSAAIAAGAWLFLLLVLAARTARDRLIIGEFKWYAEGPKKTDDPPPTPPVDLGNLLLVEISRLADLFRVVGDRRAVSSGLGHQRALDATLSIDDLVENLQGTVSSDAKASFGPVTIPLAPLVTLFGKLAQAPRLTGNLHRDGKVLILTAQISRRGGLSWRVQRTATDQPAAEDVEAVVSGIVEELALRIYTDLALGRSVRWRASQCFVEGLQSFRACLRSPKDRKFNLKRAEQRFLAALAEDEDFPLVYYNLGVVYTELHGLAVAGGRNTEAETRLSAAETSFGRAIEKDPMRWESYFAFAQTQFRYSRYDSVIELCEHIVGELTPDSIGKAKTEELWARALLEHNRKGDDRGALKQARRASRLALRSLVRARLVPSSTARGEDSPESRCAELAAGCLLTFSDVYSRQMLESNRLEPRGRVHRRQRRIRRKAQALAALAPITHGHAQVRFDFGQRLLDGGHLVLAEQELAAAVRSDPTRPSYAAGLARAQATRAKEKNGEVEASEREAIVGLCLRALQGMAGAFFPSRDANACRMVAAVYECLDNAAKGDPETAEALKDVADTVDVKLSKNVGTSVSSIFLEVLQSKGIPLATEIGEYGASAQQARGFLVAGQKHSEQCERNEAQSAFRKALASAERATSLNPLSTLAWETLGDVHRELSDFRNARLAWEQALSTDPDNPRLYDKIGSSYWHIAFQGRARALDEDLEKAADYFKKALLLYGSGSFEEQELTHYRLGKLNTALRNFGAARRHLEIVEAVQTRPPLVGWQQLGFAYLEDRNFSECEYYFGRVVIEGERLAKSERLGADAIIGDRLDEQQWPLGLIRAWGHLALAITFAERDGNLAKAHEHVGAADELLDQLELDPENPTGDERFPTRAPAACLESRGLILLREGKVEQAIEKLEEAVSAFPHSRAYFELGLALEQRAAENGETTNQTAARAQRLFGHGVNMSPASDPPPEVRAAIARLDRLAVNGAPTAA